MSGVLMMRKINMTPLLLGVGLKAVMTANVEIGLSMIAIMMCPPLACL
jgi:hypothetical protein